VRGSGRSARTKRSRRTRRQGGHGRAAAAACSQKLSRCTSSGTGGAPRSASICSRESSFPARAESCAAQPLARAMSPAAGRWSRSRAVKTGARGGRETVRERGTRRRRVGSEGVCADGVRARARRSHNAGRDNAGRGRAAPCRRCSSAASTSLSSSPRLPCAGAEGRAVTKRAKAPRAGVSGARRRGGPGRVARGCCWRAAGAAQGLRARGTGGLPARWLHAAAGLLLGGWRELGASLRS
jgi:hypothetical protein